MSARAPLSSATLPRVIYTDSMLKFALLLLLCCAPLAAVAPVGETSLTLDAATLDITISTGHSASVTHALTVTNPGESAEFTLELADNLVPVAMHGSLSLLVDNQPQVPEHTSKRFRWRVRIDGTVRLSWSLLTGTTSLSHKHPLGRRELTVRLSHLRAYAALPAAFAVNVTHGLTAEQMGRDDPAAFALEHPAGSGVQDFTLGWLGSTLAAKRAALTETLQGIAEKRRTAANRLYTTTLAHAVELAVLAQDHTVVAAHCDTLAALEATSGRAITLCGPWAEWRKYVPWQLLRLRALTALGADTKPCAKLAVELMAARWPAYLKARKAPRPFDEFDARFGVYWDYDWELTRTLYATALEITGDAAAAKAISEAEK